MALLLRVLVLSLLLVPRPVRGQEEVQALISGQLLRAGTPADSGTVVLHRVTPPADAGEIDSTSVAGDGSFSFRLPNVPVPGTDAFLVTVEYEGILYWGFPIRTPAQLDSLYTIQVYPAEAAPRGGYRFPVMIRELTLQEGPLGWLVTDAFIVQNETQTTFVPEDDEAAVWTYPLPREALGARIFDDEVGPAKGPVRFADGGIVAANPVVPGPNFYMIQYDMESVEFDVELPGEVDLARVFVREPAPAIRIEGMAAQPPTAFEGEPYLHWAAQNVRDQVIRIRLGEETASGGILWLSVGFALLLVAAGIWGVTRGTVPAPVGVPARGAGTSGGAPGRPGGARMRKEILVDLARLDEAYEGAGRPSGSTRERYVRRRARLLRELEEGGAPGRTR